MCTVYAHFFVATNMCRPSGLPRSERILLYASSSLMGRSSCGNCVRVMGHLPGAHQTGQTICS